MAHTACEIASKKGSVRMEPSVSEHPWLICGSAEERVQPGNHRPSRHTSTGHSRSGTALLDRAWQPDSLFHSHWVSLNALAACLSYTGESIPTSMRLPLQSADTC
jgi:hypothetical protein